LHLLEELESFTLQTVHPIFVRMPSQLKSSNGDGWIFLTGRNPVAGGALKPRPTTTTVAAYSSATSAFDVQ
jgi:hypothetical protein